MKNIRQQWKKLKEDNDKEKDIPCIQIGRINIVNMPLHLKSFITHSVQSLKIPMAFFIETDNRTIVWNLKDPEQPKQY